MAARSHDSLPALGLLINQSIKCSRLVLLGSRDPNGPSCVPIVTTGESMQDLISMQGDLDGGPGTSLATLYFLDRAQIKTPMQDYNWHQTRLRAFLENRDTMNAPAFEKAKQLAEHTRQFWQQTLQWREVPPTLRAVSCPAPRDWISYCFSKMNHALAAKDLVGTQRWAGELASATYSLEDLHRWLTFLGQNQLTALDFQRKCTTLFKSADSKLNEYDPKTNISQFPAGVLCLNGIPNYIEVERQAERLLSIPKEEPKQVAMGSHLTAGSLWVPPELRETFLKLQGALTPSNQKTFAMAARTPYDHSYLVNILFRIMHAKKTDDLCAVLKRFDALHPTSKTPQLLSVVMYRGHAFAGLEWGDRFQPELMQAAAGISPKETDVQALEDASRWTYKFYRAPAEYGMTLTLRAALDQKRLDCVRATDMVGAIFRNAGRYGFCNVRWCSETAAHSVSGCAQRNGEQLQIKLLDALDPTPEPEDWPSAYFHGHAWPPNVAQNPSPPYAVELYVRGLDSYVWLQGYIIRGPNAGWQYSADFPYGMYVLPASARKVFKGPYSD